MRAGVLKFRLIVLLAGIAAPVCAKVRFDVISVKPAQPGATPQDARVYMHGDRFEMTAATVGDVLYMLNNFQLFHVTDGPLDESGPL